MGRICLLPQPCLLAAPL
jgi:hypothetical protein